MTIELLQPLLEGGIRNVNFFNGRLLSAEDLRDEQVAEWLQHQRLGQAIGEGIAYGLEVARPSQPSAQPLLTIQSGLAISRAGEALRLTKPIDVSLVRPQDGSTPTPTDSVFSVCQPPQSSVYVTGSGVYLLTIGPAKGSEGRALVSGLENVAAKCNTKYTVDGVQFRLLQLNLTANELSDQRLRNLVAYKCFGVDDIQSFTKDPFRGAPPRRGLLDELRPDRLTDCEVPLAILHWTANGGIRFVDRWAARRRLIEPTATPQWEMITGDRRRGEAEAIFLQFAEHLKDLRDILTHPESAVVTDHFRYLPPVGWLPLVGVGVGFNYSKFFEGRSKFGPVFIEGSRVEPLVRAALPFAPIDLSNNEMVWLYFVRENQDRRTFAGGPTPLSYLIFASGHMPFFAEARFDVARWDYSNYTSPLAF
jgi:hypothetical protein